MLRALTLLLVVGACSLWTPTLAAQNPPPARGEIAAQFMPAPEDLPPGFVHQTDQDEITEADHSVLQTRTYIRQNPAVGPNDVTGLEIVIGVSDSTAEAADVYQRLIAAWRDEGFTFEPFPGSLGQEAVQGRHVLRPDAARQEEEVLIFWRTGSINAAVGWSDFADLPNRDDALAVAQRMAPRIAANPTPDLPPR